MIIEEGITVRVALVATVRVERQTMLARVASEWVTRGRQAYAQCGAYLSGAVFNDQGGVLAKCEAVGSSTSDVEGRRDRICQRQSPSRQKVDMFSFHKQTRLTRAMFHIPQRQRSKEHKICRQEQVRTQNKYSFTVTTTTFSLMYRVCLLSVCMQVFLVWMHNTYW